MGFRSLASCVDALRAEREAVVVESPVDPHLEIAEIQRRLYRSGGPAVLFTNPRGCPFPILVNLYGTRARVERIFADTLDRVRRLVELKIDPTSAARRPWQVTAGRFHSAYSKGSGRRAGSRGRLRQSVDTLRRCCCVCVPC